jgi:spore coat protein U-like protein
MSHAREGQARSSKRRAIRLAHGVTVLLMLAGNDARAALDCSVTTPGLAFGNYDASLTGPTDVAANLTVNCTRAFLDPWNVSYTLALSRGTSGSYAQRWMSSGPSQLNYNLYRDASRSQVWGDGTASTGVVNGSMRFNFFQFSNSASYTAYGRIPAGQSVNPGSYADSIVVTITF